eukprot:CAMPEP_0195085116 /NCGR_PEP_ID=MMETSP0448-20130528/25616_1 /TAXON_ID=66468 /ORGANISM="Heterocapsa triquestra, Strain CCMP 448" /LENGTH=126 /DNA_ID=CAMNT_0040118499 /DNA_START=121 /DNA_END=499 /DNA_ORIENTATION=+
MEGNLLCSERQDPGPPPGLHAGDALRDIRGHIQAHSHSRFPALKLLDQVLQQCVCPNQQGLDLPVVMRLSELHRDPGFGSGFHDVLVTEAQMNANNDVFGAKSEAGSASLARSSRLGRSMNCRMVH